MENNNKRKKLTQREREVQVKKHIAILTAAGIVCIAIAGTFISRNIQKSRERANIQAAKEAALQAEQEAEAAKKAEEASTITLLAAGDNIGHENIINLAKQPDNSYDFHFLYDQVKDEISQADIATIIQETILVKDENNVTGYPEFGTPVSMGDALVDAGFDVILSATNHAYDKGSQGILDTVSFWKEQHPDIPCVGITDTPEEKDRYTIVEKKGVRIAIMDYTYGLNIENTGDDAYMINMLDEETVGPKIQEAKANSDFLIFYMHAGIENEHQPSDYEKYWMNYLLEQGVDITIASHSHVVSPVEYLTDDKGHKMLAYYGLGNFACTQKTVDTLLGGIAKITLKIQENGVEISDYSFEPIISHYNEDYSSIYICRLNDYTADLAGDCGVHKYDSNTFDCTSLKKSFEEALDLTITPLDDTRIGES